MIEDLLRELTVLFLNILEDFHDGVGRIVPPIYDFVKFAQIHAIALPLPLPLLCSEAHCYPRAVSTSATVSNWLGIGSYRPMPSTRHCISVK